MATFNLSTLPAHHEREPAAGFDAANRRNGLGQQTWMKTIDKTDPVHSGFAA